MAILIDPERAWVSRANRRRIKAIGEHHGESLPLAA
jgi:hypothetical protein